MTLSQPNARLALVLAGLAGAGLILGDASPDGRLQAANAMPLALQDADGDGLHDLLELRLGTEVDLPDSDGDGILDADELILGLSPTMPNPAMPAASEPVVDIQVYQDGDQLYLQLHAICSNRIGKVAVGLVGQNIEGWLRGGELTPYVVETGARNCSIAGQGVMGFTMEVPASAIQPHLPGEIAVIAEIDGVWVGDRLRLEELDGELVEVRDMARVGNNGNNGGNGNGTGATGGLFPVAPPSGHIELGSHQVCVQTISPAGSLGGGRILYTVDDAYCDFLPGAVCFASCSSTKGDTVVGFDLPGLLGSLNY